LLTRCQFRTLLGGAFRITHRAMLNVGFVRNCKLLAQIDLRELHWNSSLKRLTFFSEVHIFPGDFTSNRLPGVLGLLSQNGMLFRVGG
jgi:hypothetical protein